MTGKIKNIVADKFFGFIMVEGRAKDLFFHKNSITLRGKREIRQDRFHVQGSAEK